MRNLRAFTEQIMGMPISVHIRAEDADRPDISVAVNQVFAHLRKVDSIFSLYRPDSELMRWRAGHLDPARLHPWVAEVHTLCLEAHDRTGGLFTPWLPRPGSSIPAPEDGDTPDPTNFDPTGLVKGWAVGGAAAYLDEVHDNSYCLNAAGDIIVGTGRGVDVAAPWRIGIEDPRQRGRIARTVEISAGSVATSGSAIRGDHFFDPRRHAWVRSNGSATVLGPDLLWADVWATAAS
ncbi:MAG: FAD:protein FMN transferase, partial [Ornithinimicrobium sp.]